jgi:inorganic pyrophosphatase
MEDEQGMDEKLLCVLEEDYGVLKDISDLADDIKEKIRYFFTNYKNNTDGRWSKVFGFQNKEFAIKLFEECFII